VVTAAEFDQDGQDLDGLGEVQVSQTGPPVPLTPGCEDKDLDGDGDQSEFGIFQRC
jgi:hypothetical protein